MQENPSKLPNAGADVADTTEKFFELYKHMFTAREVDRLEDEYTGRGEAFFHVSGAGHEAVAALNTYLKPADWLHCHYRDKSLMLARGLEPSMFFHSLFAKDASHSRGRQMSAHLSDPKLNILSLVGPVGNNALQSVGVAHEVAKQEEKPIVLCAMGEGTTQEGEVLEAIAEAVRWELPVLFLVESNKWAISTSTQGKTFFEYPSGPVDEFYGIKIERFQAVNTVEADQVFAKVVAKMREDRKPAIVVMEGERLSNHTNADDQKIYRSQDDISEAKEGADPLIWLENYLKENGFEASKLVEIRNEIRDRLRAEAEASRKSPDPVAEPGAKKDLPEKMLAKDYEYLGGEEKSLTMLEAIREVLKARLGSDESVSLYGEDIEDPKGDVFGLTRGLSTAFPGRVVNSPLTESTIVGVAAGRALAGGKPVAFLQFADFLPIAFNQLISEIGSMHWRTDGGWQCPVIVMATCGGYRPGLGPFHAQTMESIAVHTPGVDVMYPSTAYDAAGMLNAAFDSGRPTVFFYPKSCLNNRDASTSNDVEVQRVPLGLARFDRRGEDLTLVAYGNCVERCTKVADILEPEGFSCDVIDLRSLSPWDHKSVIESAKRTGKVIVVHEDNISCGMGAEVGAVLAEQAPGVTFRRVARPDTHVPFHFGNQLEILPSVKKILEVSCDLLNIEVTWQEEAKAEEGVAIIEAVGTSPSDESVTITEWNIEEGDEIEHGQNLAEYEADKASAELLSPQDGIVQEILVDEGETVKVGTPILKIKIEGEADTKPLTQEKLAPFELKVKSQVSQAAIEVATGPAQKLPVGIETVKCVLGSRSVSNEEVLKNIPEKTSDEIVRGTGIEHRYRINEKEDAVSLGASAAQMALDEAGISLDDVGMILVSTGSPGQVTPALACRILYAVGGDKYEIPAFDFSAACSGYLYGMQLAWDFLQQDSSKRVLLLTVEVLSPLLDNEDFGTAILFGDAATATLLTAGENVTSSSYRVRRPVLSAKAEPGKFLTLPSSKESGVISMNGNRVFSEGVRKMTQVLKQAMREYGKGAEDIDLVVPHQANQRIIDAIRGRMNLEEGKVYSNIAKYGNTSSNTIPLALTEIFDTEEPPMTIGLTAFGGGFTFGAGLIERS